MFNIHWDNLFTTVISSSLSHNLGGVMAIFLNAGLLLGLIFSALLLLRPVTNRLLRPKHRVALWCVGWFAGALSSANDCLGRIRVLPVTFRTLVTPRLDPSFRKTLPMYLPTDYTGAGNYTIVLPCEAEFSVPLNDALVFTLTLIWWGLLILLLVWDARQTRRLRRLGQQGQKMEPALLPEYGLDPSNTVVRICEGLPTSFVHRGYDTNWNDGVRYVVFLQKELPPAQMHLVLLHEGEHIRQYHTYFKIYISVAMYFFWWNPVLWLAYRLTCRDMELACDEGVLEKLSPGQRKDYARTLVELASGKPLWGAMTSFGECDAALRVKRVAAWKPQSEFALSLLWIATAFLFLFLYTGQREGPLVSEHTNWLNYVQGPALVDDLREETQRPDWEITEIWYRTTGQLLVRDSEGDWYHCIFHQGESVIQIADIREIAPPTLNPTYYHQLSLWED